MLTKLLKYDFIATAKIQLLMNAVMVGLCFTAFLGGFFKNNIIVSIILVFSLLVSIAYIFSYFVINALYFYKQTAGEERYLLHTLPVKGSDIILSKYLSTIIWGLLAIGILYLYWFVVVEFSLMKPLSLSLHDFFSTGDISDFSYNYMWLVVIAQYFLYLIPMTGFFICCINVPRFKNRNSGIAAAIIGWVVSNQVLNIVAVGVAFLVVWINGDISILLQNNLSPSQSGEFLNLLLNTMMVFFILFGGLFYAGMIKLITKHKSV